MRDAGCGMQDAGCRMQDAGCRMQDAGYLASCILHPLDSDFLQRLLQVSQYVFHLFNTNREADQLIRDSSLPAGFGR